MAISQSHALFAGAAFAVTTQMSLQKRTQHPYVSCCRICHCEHNMYCSYCRVIFSPQDVSHVHNRTKRAHQGSREQQPITDPSSGFTPTELHRLLLQKQKRDRQFAKQQQQARCSLRAQTTVLSVFQNWPQYRKHECGLCAAD